MSIRAIGWLAGAALAGLLLAALGWGLVHPANPDDDGLIGRPAPDLIVDGLDGSRVSLAQLRGQPVVVNFWASWCSTCRQEEAALKQAAAGHRDVRFLGVDIQDSDQAARAYQAEARYPYPVGPAAERAVAAFGVRAPPETFFLNGRGVVVARFLGPLDGPLIDRYLQLAGAAP